MEQVNVLEVFWDLVSSEPAKRREAEYTLISSLRTAQASHKKPGLAPDVDYAIKRLVKGLSSSTEAARQVGGGHYSSSFSSSPSFALSPQAIIQQCPVHLRLIRP